MSQSVHKTKKAVIQIEGILLNHKELGSLAREFLQKEVAVKKKGGASLVAQWLRIRLPMQETRVRALVQEDTTRHGATKPVRHNY